MCLPSHVLFTCHVTKYKTKNILKMSSRLKLSSQNKTENKSVGAFFTELLSAQILWASACAQFDTFSLIKKLLHLSTVIKMLLCGRLEMKNLLSSGLCGRLCGRHKKQTYRNVCLSKSPLDQIIVSERVCCRPRFVFCFVRSGCVSTFLFMSAGLVAHNVLQLKVVPPSVKLNIRKSAEMPK